MPNNLTGNTVGNSAQYLPPYNGGGSGTQAAGVQALQFRDRLDAVRSGMAGYIPSAEYPDGYLGTIQSRRADRFLDNLQKQVNDRSYTRGVHKGEKIDAADYFWPSELMPERGLVRQMQAMPQPDGTYASPRSAPLGTVAEQMIASGATEMPTTPRGKMRPLPGPRDTSPEVAASLRRYIPSWR